MIFGLTHCITCLINALAKIPLTWNKIYVLDMFVNGEIKKKCFARVPSELSSEEKDLVDISNKNIKGGEDIVFSRESSKLISYEDVIDMNEKTKLYFEVVSNSKELCFSKGNSMDIKDDLDTDDEEEEEEEGITIQERKFRECECTTLILLENEQRRIRIPWLTVVIVKLLGRKIWFKALESRLKQMWVKKGVIHVIDLGNDFLA